MKMTKEKLQSNLKLIRQAVGMSVIELSELLGVSKQTIYNVEQGKSILSDEQKEIIEKYVLECCLTKPGLDKIIEAIIA